MGEAKKNDCIRFAAIGAGGVCDYHHRPGIAIDPDSELVMLCDTSESLLAQRSKAWGIERVTADYQEVCDSDDVDAVLIATPNSTHAPIAIAAAQAGKHVFCEKPLGLSAEEAGRMTDAVKAAKVVHMTGFTYRFAPAMRWMRHLLKSGFLGEPRHFRSQRFLDWPETQWNWRQYKDKAGAGDLYDVTVHRIDFALDLLGPLSSVCGALARFALRDVTETGEPCPPSEVDDWSSMIGEFACGATGVWESTTLAKGYDRGGFGHEWAEINGSEQSAVYRLHQPNTLLLGRTGKDLEPVEVPLPYRKAPGSPRDPVEGEPATVFRYDLVWEFAAAIREGRSAVPDFDDGLRAQIVADAVMRSHQERRWIDLG